MARGWRCSTWLAEGEGSGMGFRSTGVAPPLWLLGIAGSFLKVYVSEAVGRGYAEQTRGSLLRIVKVA